MPSPTTSLATQRPDLAASFEEFDLEASRMGFVGQRILTTIPVGKQAGNFGVIPLEQLLQERETRRAPASRYNRGTWKFEPGSYATEEHGWEEPIDDREREMYRDYVDSDLIAAQRARDAVLRNAETRIITAILAAASGTAASVAWSNFASATPISDVEAKMRAIWTACGMWPNAMAIEEHDFRNLRRCDQIKDDIASSGAGSSIVQGRVSAQMIAEVLDIPVILVAGGAKNTANEPAAASLSTVWTEGTVWIGRIATSSDFREPCIGRRFVWAEDGGMPEGAIEEYRDESVRSDIFRHRHDVDEKILYGACSGKITGV